MDGQPVLEQGMRVDPQTQEIRVDGMRVNEGNWYVQIVGGTTNKDEAFPAPGTAVYTILSGIFAGVP